MWATPAVSWEILLRGGRRQLLHPPGLASRPAWLSVGTGVRRCRPPSATTPDRPAGSVLAVHPGAELYGSDRMFVESVARADCPGSRRRGPARPGPPRGRARRVGAQVVVCRMPVLRKVALRPRGLAVLARDAVPGLLPAWRLVRRARGRRRVREHHHRAVVGAARAARRPPGRPCHVHEAEWPAPRIVRVLSRCPLLAQRVVANSRFSRDVLVGSAAAAGGPVDGGLQRRPRPPAASSAPGATLRPGGTRLRRTALAAQGAGLRGRGPRGARRPGRRRAPAAGRLGVPGLRVVRGAAAGHRPCARAVRPRGVRSASFPTCGTSTRRRTSS